MSNEKPVEDPNLARRKKHMMLMLLLLLLSKEKRCCIIVFCCGRLSDMYQCITCELHFAHCRSHGIKQSFRLWHWTLKPGLTSLLLFSSGSGNHFLNETRSRSLSVGSGYWFFMWSGDRAVWSHDSDCSSCSAEGRLNYCASWLAVNA